MNFPNFDEGTDIRTFCFAGLPGPLKLDNYQRPYVWDAEKANQLLGDFRDHIKSHGPEAPYYMGMLLLHQPDNERILFVIDGQQRLTTLALLYRAMNGELPGPIQFSFGSTLSHRRIREVNKAIGERVQSDDEKLRTLLDNVTFTVLAVDQEDLAFTFFDTQNSRGVPLATTDLLKAYHLRCIGDRKSREQEDNDLEKREPRREAIQRACAQRWEGLQVSGNQEESEKTEDFAPELFNYYLWRARNWRGQHTLTRESRDQVLESFQKCAVPTERMNSIPLYPGPSNLLAHQLTLDASDEVSDDASDKVRLACSEISLSEDPSKLPFSLRQPIHEGVGFFLYTARYAAVARRLFQDKPVTRELENYRCFYQRVVDWNSPYLRQLHRLAVFMYYDQFGEHSLLRFAQALEYVLGAIRLTKQRVFQRSAMKYLEEAQLNLLDVIAGAYRSKEVIDFLLHPKHRVGDDKHLKDVHVDGRPEGYGVQGNYYDQMHQYFVEDCGFKSLNYDHFVNGLQGYT